MSIIKFIQVAGKLQTTKRWDDYIDWAGMGNEKHHEMVSDHSWKLSALVVTIIKEYGLKDYDIGKAVQIATFHDLPEAITGDISTEHIDNGTISRNDKRIDEEKAMDSILGNLQDNTNQYIRELWNEYEEASTKEAILVKCLDKLDALIHFITYTDLSQGDISNSTGHFGSYGNKYFVQCPFLKDLIDDVKSKMKDKYIEWGFEWKDEFNIDWD